MAQLDAELLDAPNDSVKEPYALRILLIEGDDRDALATGTELAASGLEHSTVRAPSLAEARRLLGEQRYDVILIALSLPDSEGFATFAGIYAAASHLPILILTKTRNDNLALRAVNAGAQDYIVKSGTSGVLLSRIIRHAVERKRSETALRTRAQETQATLEEAQRIAQLGSWEFDIRTQKGSWSNEVYRILGAELEPDSGTLEKFLTYIVPEDRARVHALTYLTAETDVLLDYECRFVRDGDLRVCHVRGRVERTPGPPKSVRILGTIQDITDRKRADEMIRASELRYRTVVEGACEGVWSADAAGITTFVNPRVSEILGYSAAEIVGRSVAEFFTDAYLALYASRAGSLMYGASDSYEAKLLRKDGSEIWAHIVGSPLRDEMGAFIGTIAMVTDVTEKRVADEKIRFQAHLLNTVDQAVIAVDHAGKVLFWNRFATVLYGWTPEEALGKHILELTPAETSLEQGKAILQQLAEGRTWSGEYNVRRKDGTTFPALVTDTPIFDDDGESIGVVGVSVDLSERVRLEEQLRQSQKLEAVGQLAGGMAHDFNNILTSISGNAELLLDALSADGAGADLVEEIKTAAARATGLTRQLLAFSRKQTLQPETLDLGRVVSDMEKMLRRLIREDIELVASIEAGSHHVTADLTQLEQVIMNLVVNARDAMPAGGRISVSVHSRPPAPSVLEDNNLPPGGYWTLEVRDTGEGIPPEVIGRIFDPFFTTKALGSGTGLGLATVYGIVKQSGGAITVESTVGSGTIFRVLLPESTAPAAAVPQRDESPPLLPAGGTILVVEDEEMVRRLVTRTLGRAGFVILEATDSQHALQIQQQHVGPIDLVLSDVVMPGMGGPALIAKMREAGLQAPVLFMSGYTADHAVLAAALDAYTALIEKPFTPTVLLRKIAEILAPRAV